MPIAMLLHADNAGKHNSTLHYFCFKFDLILINRHTDIDLYVDKMRYSDLA